MTDIPFSPLDATLKQIVLADYDEHLRALFPLLFPRFFDVKSHEWSEEAIKAYESIPGAVLGQPIQPRRFGGYIFPRGHYYTVCTDDEGNDGGALMHELRAYRNAVVAGRVEVVDFALGDCVLVLGERHVPLKRCPAMGVVIHEPARVSSVLDRLPHEKLESSDGNTVALVKMPLGLRRVRLSKTIDLRRPDTRTWFARQFSQPLDDDWIWPEAAVARGMQYPDPAKTIGPRFDVVEARAPIPRTFAEMLPTLINPARGGGELTWGGVTLMGICEWLRNRGVEALIYPSARSDAYALYHRSRLQDFGGWCCVDYRPESSEEEQANYIVFDSSPWSWHDIMPGTRIGFARDDADEAGSLLIDGIVRRSSEDYNLDVASIVAAEQAVGPVSAEPTRAEAFALGTSIVRWLHLAFVKADSAAVWLAYREAHGLILRRDREMEARRLKAIRDQLVEDQSPTEAFGALLKLSEHLTGWVPDSNNLVEIYAAAADLESMLFMLTLASASGETHLKSSLLPSSAWSQLVLPNPLGDQAAAFVAGVSTAGSDVRRCRASGFAVGRELARYCDADYSVEGLE